MQSIAMHALVAHRAVTQSLLFMQAFHLCLQVHHSINQHKLHKCVLQVSISVTTAVSSPTSLQIWQKGSCSVLAARA